MWSRRRSAITVRSWSRWYRSSADAVGEVLDHLASLFVAVLHGRRLHEICRRPEQRAADAAVLGELGATDGVDDDAGRVRRVPHLELQLDVERHVAEVAAFQPDVGPLPVLEPGH